MSRGQIFKLSAGLLLLLVGFQNCGAPMSQSTTSTGSSQNRGLASNGVCYPAENCEPNLHNVKILSPEEVPLTLLGPITNATAFSGEIAGQCDVGEYAQHKIIVRWSRDSYGSVSLGIPEDEIKCDPEGRFYLHKKFDANLVRQLKIIYAELSVEVSDSQSGPLQSYERTSVRLVYPLSN